MLESWQVILEYSASSLCGLSIPHQKERPIKKGDEIVCGIKARMKVWATKSENEQNEDVNKFKKEQFALNSYHDNNNKCIELIA